ncbi:multiple sugar transport system ATP-binding protein [Thermocatellispora tengchongensis]|uniref:Multiple sugar transport system ATP-binding protein n=1 Tax=Thermocatellispora tengchongensis TaxID=1073253 RepID=A0A840PQ34_9ACTN|nr:ABC transporter ATP-binding protein [Thermocatellispora tengchongensis]MBB5139187.1 multiple sugar transport system ATP-binding protein [Thermocatellispora tengchongensis]
MSRIRLQRLTRRFGSVTAVDAVSLDVADGEFLVLLGPSGCGKSTLLRMIAGLLAPTEGRVLLGDADITDVPPRRRDLAMVFQSYALYPHLSVARNIGFPLRARGWSRAAIREKVAEVAAALDLTELLDRRPRELSGGQRQRVALGRALVRDPGAFLMDEPLSNLDAALRAGTRAEISALHKRLGATVVYVTHDQVEAMTMATRIALLDKGRLEQVGTPAEVYDEPASVFVARFLGSPAMNLIDATVAATAAGLAARAREVELPLGIDAETPERPVVLGVRPEHLAIAGQGAEGGIRAVVEAVENLGSEEVAHCRAGEARVSVRGPRPLGLRDGDRVRLTARPEHLHLFDADSGRRLAWRPAPVTTPA